ATRRGRHVDGASPGWEATTARVRGQATAALLAAMAWTANSIRAVLPTRSPPVSSATFAGSPKSSRSRHADLHLDVRLLRLLVDRDPAAHVAEPAADLGDHAMAADELHGGVGAVDLVDTGHRDHSVVAGPEHAHRLIRHPNSSLPTFDDTSTIGHNDDTSTTVRVGWCPMAKPRWLDERQQRVWQGYLHLNQDLIAVLEQQLARESGLSGAD